MGRAFPSSVPMMREELEEHPMHRTSRLTSENPRSGNLQTLIDSHNADKLYADGVLERDSILLFFNLRGVDERNFLQVVNRLKIPVLGPVRENCFGLRDPQG